MPAKKRATIERRGYHHGNLKEALIDAARELIAERGVAGFTLIDAAKMAGVSAAAPYRHFKDRDTLIGEVARRGFAAFAARLGAAWQGVQGDPLTGFGRMGDAYLAFAREEPGYYAAMFSGKRRAPPSDEPSFGGLQQAIAAIGGATGVRIDPREMAYLVWALSHGIATLSAAGQIPREASLAPETLLSAGVSALIHGRAADAAAPARAAIPRVPAAQGADAPSDKRQTARSRS